MVNPMDQTNDHTYANTSLNPVSSRPSLPLSHSQASSIPNTSLSPSSSSSECPICYQKYVHPVKLPCKHIFCFLCIKGAALTSKRCAMCRAEIDEKYFDSPELIQEVNEKDVPGYDEGHALRWYYEGRNGWWLYDERTSEDIESAFKANQDKCELLIAGFLYVIDLKRMIQYRRNEPHRVRNIKRDVLDDRFTKGVAGLRRQGFVEQVVDQTQSVRHPLQDHDDHESVSASSSSSQDHETSTNESVTSHSQSNESVGEEGDDEDSRIELFTVSDSSISHQSDLNHSHELEQSLESQLTLNETNETYL